MRKQAGFPCVSVDDVEKVEVSEESEGYSDDEDEALSSTGKKESKPLDPRAGRVDVELPQLPFDAAKIAQSLQEHVFHASSNAKSRRQLRRLIEEYVLYLSYNLKMCSLLVLFFSFFLFFTDANLRFQI